MAPLPALGPPVSAPRDPVSPADDDDDHDETGNELDPMIGRRSGAGGGGGGMASMDLQGVLDDENDLHDDNETPPPRSLQDRLIQLLSSWPSTKLQRVAPVQVATELGISVEDATAELCRLLAAVGNDPNDGDGATFSFVRLPREHEPPLESTEGKAPAAAPSRPIPDHVTMVFSFPKDFQRRARRSRRRSDLADLMRELGVLLFKVVKVVTALGLFVSLAIVGIVAAVAAMAALVALSRHGFSTSDAAAGRHLRQHLRTMCITCQNCLWCYAVFTPTDGGGRDGGGGINDPFLRDLAADLSLLCSCLRGNPFSVWYWLHFRRNRFRQPRRQVAPYRGIVRMGRWGTPDDEDDRGARDAVTASEPQSLLGVAAEFLFGPTPFAPGPSPAEKWRLRARIIVDKCAAPASPGSAISLAELAPFVDSPPASFMDSQQLVAQGLVLVSHFRGIPSLSATASVATDVRGSPQSSFVFPELMAESAHLSGSLSGSYGNENIEMPWTKNLFYEAEPSTTYVHSRSGRTLSSTSPKVPSFLVELPYGLTKLTQRQFVLCAFLVTINALGVLWLRQSVCVGGAASRTALGYVLCRVVVPVLHFYSILFVALPLGRLAVIVLWNAQIRRRNRRRRNLAKDLES